MNDENKTCYETSEQNLFTRYETKKSEAYVLPYSGLLFAHLSAPGTGNTEILTLTYITHTVVVRGLHILPLLLVVQKGRAESIRVGGQADGTTKSPAIREILITEGSKESQTYEK